MQPEFWNDKRPAGVPDSLDFAAYRSVVEVFAGPGAENDPIGAAVSERLATGISVRHIE